MRARRLALTASATLGVFGGVLVFSSTPALAAFESPYLSQLTGISQASAVAIDSSGDTYVADERSVVIDRFNGAGEPSNFSGSAAYINGSQLTGTPSGPFKRVQGVTVDASGNIYVVEGNSFSGSNLVVDVFNSSGEYQRRLTGVAFTSLNGGITVNRVTGTVYVIDPSSGGGGVVDVFNSSGEYQSQFGAGIFANPRSVAVNDSTGAVYVGDSNTDDVYVFDASGVLRATWTGGNTPDGSFGLGQVAVAVDNSTNAADAAAGGVYVMDSDNAVVDIFDSSGSYLSQMTGTPNGAFNNPRSVSVDSAGQPYVIDPGQQAIDIFGALTKLPDVFTGTASNLVPASGNATLNGTVNPLETTGASYYFEYGTDTTYGASSPVAPGTPVAGNSVLPATTNLAGLLPNLTYHYRLDGTNGSGVINFGQDQTFILAARPTVNDQPPSAVNASRVGVTFTGTLNPENNETFYHFVYVDAADYASSAAEPYGAGGSTAVVSAGAGLGDQTVGPVNVGGLRPGTTYHYALVASNAAGTTISSPDQTFTTTSATPPIVVTGGASNVGENAATISGSVDTNGLQTTDGFQIGTDTNYGPATGLGSVGAGLTATVTLDLENLQPGTTYYYRLLASSVDGTTFGSSLTFTTPGFPSPLATVAVAPLIPIPGIAFPAEAEAPTPPKSLTKAQKLSKALRACRHKPRKQRTACRREARKKYGPRSKKHA
jgi:hypothetical protein